MAQGQPVYMVGAGGAPAQVASPVGGFVAAPAGGVVGGGALGGGGAVGGGGGADANCGVVPGGCGVAGLGVGCGTDVDHATVPTYVGSGGDLAPETTYKYVGPGRGNLEAAQVATGVFNWWYCSIPIVILWLLVGWYFYNQECWFSCTVPQKSGSCTFWGDPHFWTFDNEMRTIQDPEDAYPNGDFWMVRTPTIWIQGRYRPTTWLMTNKQNDRACTRAIGFGGPFMQGNKFIIEAFKKATTSTTDDGQITYNGNPVMTTFPSNFDSGPVHAKYHNLGHSVDIRRQSDQLHIVDVLLPGVHVQVNRWKEYIDGKITMQSVPGMTGHCGNFNGNAPDDQLPTLDAMGAHKPLNGGPNGGRVSPSELIFEPTTFIVQKHFPAIPKEGMDSKFTR